MPLFFSVNEDIPTEFCNLVIKTIADFVGLEYCQSVLLKRFKYDEVFLDKKGIVISQASLLNSKGQIGAVIEELIKSTEKDFGRDFSEDKLRHAFLTFAKTHTKDKDFHQIVGLIPTGYLENEKLRYISKDELENTVRENVQKLQEVNQELEERVKIRTENLEKANEELKKLDIAKSHFISIVAHQLRTPLTGIKWSLDFLISGGAGPLTEKQKELAMEISDSGEQMTYLVNDFLNADNIQSGTITYEFKPTYIVDLINDILKRLTNMAAEKGVIFDFIKDDNLPLVSADSLKMKVILQNLIENAIKYNRKDSEGKNVVTISVAVAGPSLRITIHDTGIGIPKDQQPFIFQRFFRARNAYLQEPNGSGLGLFITKEIVTAHKGMVTFESQENAGTTFTIYIPTI